ncbi:GNAT family N-acetyltransferase [Nocardioides rotundus]|uniref:GNAT family N-acetyltransferase n=1 Tax=Nocardioides rotundus TaxID=1774216 RepID=UPI001CBB6281|nr:GNAT family N-acetyltransferase [Nocardioides rotundus]UAL28430.1 GNAT family N-acetyltransferase [Nocardioides rotundus]
MSDAVRPARPADLRRIAEIEDSGLAMFEEALGDLTGTPLAAPAPEGGERAAQGGHLLVAGDPPIGFAHVLLVDGHAHLEQLSVEPEHGRRGIGTALLEAACRHAAGEGHGAITLMTYADLAWNAPFYARHGFEESEPLDGYERGLIAHERQLGLPDFGRRVLMRRALRTPGEG